MFDVIVPDCEFNYNDSLIIDRKAKELISVWFKGPFLAGSGPTPASNINNHLTAGVDPSQTFTLGHTTSIVSHNRPTTNKITWVRHTA